MKHLEALEMQEKGNKEIEPDDEIGRVKIRDQGMQPPSGISKEVWFCSKKSERFGLLVEMKLFVIFNFLKPMQK